MHVAFTIRCKNCGNPQSRRARRRWWMHLLPFSIYVVCDDCARESLALFARHPEPEPGAEPRRHSQPDGDPDGGDGFVDGAYQELAREYLEEANHRRHKRRRRSAQLDDESDPAPEARAATSPASGGKGVREAPPPAAEPERPASRSAQDSVKDAAVQPEVQPPHPESPDMAGADDAEERATGQRDRMDPLRELRRRRAETRASLDSVRQKFGDLDPGAGSA